jgi:hypothetical protein
VYAVKILRTTSDAPDIKRLVSRERARESRRTPPNAATE